VKGQEKLNTHIISESVLMLFTRKKSQNQSILDERTACQSWLVFWDTV